MAYNTYTNLGYKSFFFNWIVVIARFVVSIALQQFWKHFMQYSK